jgi:tetrahydromethanopterin S-methyltransferase subunit B
MKHSTYFLIFILLTSLYACSLSEKEQVKQLEEQVLKEHDEVMSQMDKINQKQRKLQAYLQKADTTQINTQLIRNQITNLKKADAAMMDWMHQYKSPTNELPEKANIYLQDQLVKIERVKKQVANALDNTEKI